MTSPPPDADASPPSPGATDAEPFDVRVVSHTHWDREWYEPAGRFRQRLVALVDELLDAPDGAFLLDGQAVVLDDYLDVRPERRDELSAALASGTIEAGPWYVLADELIPSGEALVRNLLAGRRALRELGAVPPPVLYCPDSFGHPAALPAIARGFGYDVAILWRGYGGARWPAGDAARWRAPSGESVTLLHLPRDGYELGSNLPADDDGARRRWTAMRAELAPRSRLGLLLVQNGADHHARQQSFGAAIAALTRAAAPDRVARSSLGEYVREASRRASATALPEVRGELRDSYGYTWTLQGTFATRAAQKRRNAVAERSLVREAEPWAAVALGAASLSGARPPFAALLRAAWRTLLLCHPHDTLCGCSTDEVARAMDARLEDATSQARGIAADALMAALGHDPVRARTRKNDWRRALVVRNSAARPRGGVAEVELLTFLHDVPVGPGSAGAPRHSERPRAAPVRSAGDVLPVQVLERTTRHDRTESPRHYPDDDLVESARAVVWVDPVGGYGTTSYELEEAVSRAALPAHVEPVRLVGENGIANGIVRVAVGRGGEVAVQGSGWSVESLLGFEDVGDAGDLYTHSPVGRVATKSWFLGASVVHDGPLRGEIEARWRIRVPAARGRDVTEIDEPATAIPPRGGRSASHVELPLAVRITIDAGSPAVRVRVSGENRARDHRLRVVFTTGVAPTSVVADAAFGPVERVPIEIAPAERAVEAAPPTAPLHRYVSLYGERAGATLLADGLAEYEALPDGRVAVTLVRAVGELSRGALPERPGHAGWPTPTPAAQSLGPFEANFALLAHGPRDAASLALVERVADDVLVPLVGTTVRSLLAVPSPTLGVELEGDGLAFSAAKPADADDRSVVLRCVNVTDAPVRGRWRLGVAPVDAWLSRLDETLGTPLDVDADGSIGFDARPRAIATIVVRIAR